MSTARESRARVRARARAFASTCVCVFEYSRATRARHTRAVKLLVSGTVRVYIKAVILLNEYGRLSFPTPGAPRQVYCCEEAGGGDEAECEPTADGGVR